MSLECCVLGVLLLSVMKGSVEVGRGGVWLCDLAQACASLARRPRAVEAVVEMPTLPTKSDRSAPPTPCDLLWSFFSSFTSYLPVILVLLIMWEPLIGIRIPLKLRR